MPHNFTYTQRDNMYNMSLETLYELLSVYRVCTTVVYAVYAAFALLVQARFYTLEMIPFKEYTITM
jgi:hypothetical protein